MSLEYFHVHMPKWLSPVVILILLMGGTGASFLRLVRPVASVAER